MTTPIESDTLEGPMISGASAVADRAFVPSASSQQAVSPVPASIPSADDYRLSREAFTPASYEGKRRWLGKAHKATLHQFTDPIWARVKASSDAQLWDILDACLSVSPINCGWDEYAIARMIGDVVQFEIKERLEASAIETRSAETTGSVGEADESAVAKPDAQNMGAS